MAYNTTPGRAEYVATAAQTNFPFLFKIFSETDIKVYQTPVGNNPDDINDLLVYITDYTVSINGDLGGEIELVSGAALGDAITLVRDLPVERTIEYQTSGDLLASTLNMDLNYNTYLTADREQIGKRYVSIPESAQNVSTVLPSPIPLNFVQWDAAGSGFQNVGSLQADGFIWTAADVYSKTEVYNKNEADALLDLKADQSTTYTKTEVDAEVSERRKLYAAETTTHNFTSDADYTLTAAQNLYGRIVLTDTSAFLTTARNVITDNIEKSFIVQNDTLQTITVKTLAGTGISISPGEFSNLYNDGANIITLDIPQKIGLLAEFEVAGAAVTSIDFSGLDISVHKSYSIEMELTNATGSAADIYLFVNNDTTLTNYYTQIAQASATTQTDARVNTTRIAGMSASAKTSSHAHVNLVDSEFNATSRSTEGTPSVIIDVCRSIKKIATVANVTQLTFTSSVASAIGIGSKIRIYRGDA